MFEAVGSESQTNSKKDLFNNQMNLTEYLQNTEEMNPLAQSSLYNTNQSKIQIEEDPIDLHYKAYATEKRTLETI